MEETDEWSTDKYYPKKDGVYFLYEDGTIWSYIIPNKKIIAWKLMERSDPNERTIKTIITQK